MSSPIRKPHSPRFVRLSAEAMSSLFGEPMEPRFTISNGRFVARQRVAIVGPRGRLDGVPVVGPAVDQTQITFGEGDEERLGLDDRGVILAGAAGELKVPH